MLTDSDNLVALLNEAERGEINNLVKQASAQGAQAFSWWSPTRCLVLFGVAADGELLTWFASPANNQAEAATVQAVIAAGMQLAARAVQDLNDSAAAATDDLLARFRH